MIRALAPSIRAFWRVQLPAESGNEGETGDGSELVLNDVEGEHLEVRPAVAVRQGILFLAADDLSQKSAEMLAGICDALKADSRIRNLKRPENRDHLVRRDLIYPRIDLDDIDRSLTGGDHLHSHRLSDPIVFELVVPASEQEAFRGDSSFPIGSYWVAWDGIVVMVAWQQPSDEEVSLAAGRVAFDVITAAVTKANLRTLAQACSPGCHNRFTHTNVLVVEKGSREPASSRHAVIRVSSLSDVVSKDLRIWFGMACYTFFLFALYKNQARRIRDLADAIDYRLQALLSLRQRRQSISFLSRRRDRLKERRELFGWQKISRKCEADVWLAAASIELHRGTWDEKRRRFRDNAPSLPADVFARDIKDDEVAVDTLDLDFARAALQYSSARFDAQMLAIVTGLAGVAAIAGAAVGAVVTGGS